MEVKELNLGEVLVHLTLDYWTLLECIQAMPQCGIYCDLQLTGRQSSDELKKTDAMLPLTRIAALLAQVPLVVDVVI